MCEEILAGQDCVCGYTTIRLIAQRLTFSQPLASLGRVHTHSVSSFSFFFFLPSYGWPIKEKGTDNQAIHKRREENKRKKNSNAGIHPQRNKETDESNSIGEGTYFLFSFCSPSWTDLNGHRYAAVNMTGPGLRRTRKEKRCCSSHWRLASHWAQ